MTHTTPHAAAFTRLAFGLLFVASAALAAPPEPGKVLTAADVQSVLGAAFAVESPEPGVLFYSEEGGTGRVVELTLWPANGKTVSDLAAQLRQDGEPIEEIPGIGDAAVYRPQRMRIEVERRTEAGDALWLGVGVNNVSSADETRRLVLELARRAAARL